MFARFHRSNGDAYYTSNYTNGYTSKKKKKNSWSKKNHENPISSKREVSRVSRWQSFPKMYFTLPVKEREREREKTRERKKKKEEETEERKIFLLSANFRSRVSLSNFIVVFSKLHLAKTEFHVKFPESNKGRSTIQQWIECLSRKSSTLNIPTILLFMKMRKR